MSSSTDRQQAAVRAALGGHAGWGATPSLGTWGADPRPWRNPPAGRPDGMVEPERAGTRMGWAGDSKGVKKLAEWRGEISQSWTDHWDPPEPAGPPVEPPAADQDQQFEPTYVTTGLNFRQIAPDRADSVRPVALHRDAHNAPHDPRSLASLSAGWPGPTLAELLPEQLANIRPHCPEFAVLRYAESRQPEYSWAGLGKPLEQSEQPEQPDQAEATEAADSTALVAAQPGGALVPAQPAEPTEAGPEEQDDEEEVPLASLAELYNLEWVRRREQLEQAQAGLDSLRQQAQSGPTGPSGQPAQPGALVPAAGGAMVRATQSKQPGGQSGGLAGAQEAVRRAHSAVWDGALLAHWAEQDRRALAEPARLAVLEATEALAAVPHGQRAQKEAAEKKLESAKQAWRQLHPPIGSNGPAGRQIPGVRLADPSGLLSASCTAG